MSKKLNNSGNIVNINETINGLPYFHKPTTDPNELKIARLIKRNPHPHIVKIYRVGENYVDMELVNVYVSKGACLEQEDGLRRAKDHMHRYGIVYLDWKADNMGRGEDGRIKLYDFDMSGLLRRGTNNWNRPPTYKGYLFRQAENAGQVRPISIDNWIFERFTKR